MRAMSAGRMVAMLASLLLATDSRPSTAAARLGQSQSSPPRRRRRKFKGWQRELRRT